MVTPAVDGIDLFKIAGRSISGWIPSLKTGITVRQPFCSQLEERLLLWLEYNPQVVSYARGDIGPAFAKTYRLPTFSRVGLFKDPLNKRVLEPSLDEFSCARACVGAGDALGRAEEEEPLWEDVAQSRIG